MIPFEGFLLLLLFIASVKSQQEFYCDSAGPVTISGITTGYIRTRNQGTEFYGNSFDCVWKILGESHNRIQLTVESLDLQWSAQYATCAGYDSMEIREGLEADSPVLTTACHARNPYSVISNDHALYLRFTSTHQNFGNHRGLDIRFELFNNVSCPPDWFQVSPSAADCYMIDSTGIAVWSRAQDICNFNRANLASILTEQDFNTILDHGRNISGSLVTAWIGLRDLHETGTFHWIDKQKFSYKSELTGKKYNTFCIAQDFQTGEWSVHKCDTQLNYVCKAKKDGSTILYQAEPPSEPPEEDDKGTKLYLIVIIVVVIIVVGGVAAVVFYCCFWRNYREKRLSRTEKGRSDSTSREVQQFSSVPQASEPTAPPQENVMLHDFQLQAPPTYEESQFDPVSPSTY